MFDFLSYYRSFVCQLWRDAGGWARDNILWAALMVAVPFGVAALLHSGKPDWQFLRITMSCYAALFLLYIAVHSVRTPWKLDKERRKEIRGKQTEIDCKQAEIEDYRAKLAESERKLHDGRPQLNLLVLADEVMKWNEGQLPFDIQNSGQRPARFIDIRSVQSETGKYKLQLKVVHREVLIPNSRPNVLFEVFENVLNPPHIIEAMKSNIKMLQLFFKDGNSKVSEYPVEITCHDTGPSIFTDRMVLVCERPSLRLTVRPLTQSAESISSSVQA
jgi:hypothetical protein